MTKTNSTHAAGPAEAELDRLTGYQGSIQFTALDTALDEQRSLIWEAQAVIDCVIKALEERFGDWPKDMANFPMALSRASRTLDDVATKLDAGNLEDRALAIAREREDAAEMEAVAAH